MTGPALCPALECLDAGFAGIPPAVLSTRLSSLAESSRQRPDLGLKKLGSDSAVTVKNQCTGPCLLLSLPVEIRLQIYDWIYRTSPVRKNLALTGYPLPVRQPRFTTSIEYGDKVPRHGRKMCGSHLLRQDRLYNCVPSNVLVLSRQIYTEAREIPFHSNEFVFENWFSSGLIAASFLLRDVFEPWQAKAMRFARIEARGTDFRDERGFERWRRLSANWVSCVRGLRVLIHVSTDAGSEESGLTGILDGVGERWVVDGCLAQLQVLEKLEVELVTPSWFSDDDKLAWCRALEAILRAHGSRAVVSGVKCDVDSHIQPALSPTSR
ncbi:uncharacterized protein MAM_05433 [Metarhizium album ARSEF 1941]|uniref:Uncharacterized protein n=1 Tax=Metarhizium album (strain ARSEF 1941) TaxID=1081103 RepID=A0A0B2WTT5_METAS|nr:uncharacterized protein MAM_05433 [Metarhizium album ARSEF 1941]KHN96877.1 hypothetical protein MAM_05433 [Metarhizium album ARSEF 1941]